ncbi:MAG TPA: deoxyguanosinetriphosphate triphosphohydrolase, partial [Hyphomicrobiales bacterium]|nr:deoxyguanosinetriphosphate triphosphohydrolase [Hyphomicrobiales bacterium]
AAEGLPAAIVEYGQSHDLDLASYASAEAQIAALADDIAYNNHDLDDGLRAGLFEIRKLHDLPLVGKFIDEIKALYGEIADGRLIYEVNRRLISAMVFDVAGEASKRIAALNPQSVDDIRSAPDPIASFSEPLKADLRTLREFLFAEFYYHPRVRRIMDDAQKIVRDLFSFFLDHPDKLPDEWREQAQTKEKGRVVADFVAGMTDRMALETHRRLFDDTPQLR